MTSCAGDEKFISVVNQEIKIRSYPRLKSVLHNYSHGPFRAPAISGFTSAERTRLALPMSSEDTLAERVSSFISDNKRGIVIGVAAAAVAVGGVAYYVASSRASGGGRDEESLRAGKKKDKKKKRPSKTVKDQDTPILEERKPKAAAAAEDDDG